MFSRNIENPMKKMAFKREQRDLTNAYPVIEEIDLMTTAKAIFLKKDFRFITRVIFNIEWTEVNYNWLKFGIDAALTNGIQLMYHGNFILPHGLVKNSDFGAIAYDTSLTIDNAAAKNALLQSRLSFFKFTHKGEGLRITNAKRFAIVVQDDLSGSLNNVIECYVQGWRFNV